MRPDDRRAPHVPLTPTLADRARGTDARLAGRPACLGRDHLRIVMRRLHAVPRATDGSCSLRLYWPRWGSPILVTVPCRGVTMDSRKKSGVSRRKFLKGAAAACTA